MLKATWLVPALTPRSRRASATLFACGSGDAGTGGATASGGSTSTSPGSGGAGASPSLTSSESGGATSEAGGAGNRPPRAAPPEPAAAGPITPTSRSPKTPSPKTECGSTAAPAESTGTTTRPPPNLAIGHQQHDLRRRDRVLTGAWGPTQTVTATVHSPKRKDTCYQEVEMRLRSANTPPTTAPATRSPSRPVRPTPPI